MTQYTVNEAKAKKLFWPGIIEDLIRHEALIPISADMSDIANDLVAIAELAMAGTHFATDSRVLIAKQVIQELCRHPFENIIFSNEEYGGSTCGLCGYYDTTFRGR